MIKETNLVQKLGMETSAEQQRNCQRNLVEKIKTYIDTHYMEDSLNISSIADYMGKNPKYIARVFRSETGEGMLDYINRVRIRKAVTLLRIGRNPANEVGLQVGYATYKSFCRAFIRGKGVTPSVYSKKERAI